MLPVGSIDMTGHLRVLRAGPGETVQDGGRHGFLRYGVSAAGAMDWVAHATANLALGNERGAAAIEISIAGIDLMYKSPMPVVTSPGSTTAKDFLMRPSCAWSLAIRCP